MDSTITSAINKPLPRAILKELFKNGIVPSEEDFASLIDSVLVRRDDRFFGFWQNGIGYSEGDVVFYSDPQGEMGIYVFVSKKQAEKIAKDQGKDCDCLEDDCCGNKPPGKCCRWQRIEIGVHDDNWHVVQDGGNQFLYADATVFSRLGYGTDSPEAFFHLNAAQEGAGSQLLFSPIGGDGGTRLRIKEGGQSDSPAQESTEPLYVDQSITLNGVESSVEWLTNVPVGYVFKKQTSAGTDPRKFSDMTLLLIGSDQNMSPRIGIGTSFPQAALDVAYDEKNSIRLDVNDPGGPQLMLLKVDDKGGELRITQTFDGQYARWGTTAPLGFLFAATDDKPLVNFDAAGNVGLGTITPTAKLDIIDENGNNGRFVFDVDSVTPTMTVTNYKNDGSDVNLTLSVENSKTVFDTDAQQGFEFRKEGKRMMALSPDSNAKVPTFSTLVDGFVHTDGLYVRSMKGNVIDLKSGLVFLKTLEPKLRLPEGDNHMQMGFVFTGKKGKGSEIARQFPDDTFGIAQHNLIAILVRSVQELQDQINDLRQEISDLKGAKNEPGKA